jgi:hypothetical protein
MTSFATNGLTGFNELSKKSFLILIPVTESAMNLSRGE